MNRYILIVITLFLFASCEDVINVEVKSQEQGLYAIEAKITTIDEPWVFVTKTLGVTVDQPYVGISNLIVTLSDDAQPSDSIVLVEDADRKGYYTVPQNEDFYGVAGKTYTLTLLTPEGVTITSTETLDPVEPIDSIEVRPSLRGDERFLAVFTYGKETPGVGNYYKWDIFINDTILYVNNAEYLAFASDELVDGNYISGLEIFTDFHDPNKESERILKYLDTVYVQQSSTPEFAYNYYLQVSNQASSGSLFSVPPANIPGNFTSSDGKEVVGLFSAHDVSTSNMVVIDSTIENQLVKLR